MDFWIFEVDFILREEYAYELFNHIISSYVLEEFVKGKSLNKSHWKPKEHKSL